MGLGLTLHVLSKDWTPVIIESLTPDEVAWIKAFSSICGILSLSIWFIAQLPQIIHNHINRSVEGISPGFLIFWVGGDVASLSGCLISNTLPFQIGLAGYSCFVDFILVCQYWFYTSVYPRQKNHLDLLESSTHLAPSRSTASRRIRQLQLASEDLHHSDDDFDDNNGNNENNSNNNSRSKKLDGQSSSAAKALTFSLLGKASALLINREPISTQTSKINPFGFIEDHVQFIGATAGWIGASFYIFSRVSQIKANYHTKAVEGFSPFLFIFAIMGDSFYTISVLSELFLIYHSDKSNNENVLLGMVISQLPYVLGSMTTISLDLFILFQFKMYSSNNGSLSASNTSESSDTFDSTQFPKKVDYGSTASSSLWGSETKTGFEALKRQSTNSDSCGFAIPRATTITAFDLNAPPNYVHSASSSIHLDNLNHHDKSESWKHMITQRNSQSRGGGITSPRSPINITGSSTEKGSKRQSISPSTPLSPLDFLS